MTKTRMYSRRYDDVVRFANFAREHKLKPFDLAILCDLADKRFKLESKICGFPEYQKYKPKEERLRKDFEELAAKAGFETEWNGLSPTLLKGGQSYYLPLF